MIVLSSFEAHANPTLLVMLPILPLPNSLGFYQEVLPLTIYDVSCAVDAVLRGVRVFGWLVA